MEGDYSAQNGRSSASWWLFVVAALLVGGIIGYYLGSSGVGTGLVPEENERTLNEAEGTNVGAEIETEEPANPFEDEGYQNPFE